MADKDESEKTIAEDLVVTKYKMAGDIVNRVLKQVIDACVPEASVRQVCEYGDSLLSEETSKVFKKEKELRKGIAFPTCISVNNCICHYSPLESEPEQVTLKEGDVVKVDLGAHIDGFIAVVAHTIIVGAKPSEKITGRKADAMLAAHYASQTALRLLKPGNQTYAITEAVQKVCESFKCKPVEGMLSHQLKQGKIDGEKTIIQNPTDAQKKEHEKFELETHEVYAMDVLVSTGEGVGREMNTRVSVYKKTDETYQLKLKASRFFYSEVRDKHGSMPFTLRSFADEKKARMGVNECVSHKLIEPFHVLYEKPSELVVQFKFTVLLMPNGPHKITGLPFETENFQSEHSIEDPELKAKYYGDAMGEVAEGKCTEIEDTVLHTIDSYSPAVEGSAGVSVKRPAKTVRKRKKPSEASTNSKEDVFMNESSADTNKNDSGQDTASQSKRQRRVKSAIAPGSEEVHASKLRAYALKREIVKLELQKTRLQIRLMDIKLRMGRSGFSRAVPEDLVEVTTDTID